MKMNTPHDLFSLLNEDVLLQLNNILLIRSLNKHYNSMVDKAYVNEYVLLPPSTDEINEYYSKYGSYSTIIFSYTTRCEQHIGHYQISMCVTVNSLNSTQSFSHAVFGDFSYDDNEFDDFSVQNSVMPFCKQFNPNNTDEYIHSPCRDPNLEGKAHILNLDPISILAILKSRLMYNNEERMKKHHNLLINEIIRKVNKIAQSPSSLFYCFDPRKDWISHTGNPIWLPDFATSDIHLNCYILYSFVLALYKVNSFTLDLDFDPHSLENYNETVNGDEPEIEHDNEKIKSKIEEFRKIIIEQLEILE